jgi:hypothetical protein
MLRKLVVVGLVGILSFAANVATADDAAAPAVSVGASDVSFADPADSSFWNRFRINMNEDSARSARFEPASAPPGAERTSGYELSLVARAATNVDVAFAHRNGFAFNDQGDIARETQGSELRLGRGLAMRRNQPSSAPIWYLFAGSQDEALIWRPGARSAFGGAAAEFALQDRVEIGDRQAGITYEVRGIQASLAYVERRVRFTTGSNHVSEDENFTGVTLTMRH